MATATWTRPAFRGNPFVTITAINTAGGISVNRTSGYAPLFVKVSAKNITATGTSRPYEDLEYRWTCTESFSYLRPSDGQLADQNVQYGPEAVFRLTGNETITLRIRGADGVGGYVEETITLPCTITADDLTAYYFDADLGDDTTGDGSIGNPWQSADKVAAQLILSGGKTRCLLKRGTTNPYLLSDQINLYRNNLRVEPYGSGSRPVIQTNTGSWSGTRRMVDVNISHGGVNYDDVVISEIDFDGQGHSEYLLFVGGGGAGQVHNHVFDQCSSTGLRELQGSDVNISPNSGATLTGNGFWHCDFDNQHTTGGRRHCIFMSYADQFFVVGGSIVGDGEDANLDHHIYPAKADEVLFADIDFGASTDRNYAINCACVDDVGQHSEFWNIRGCNVTGTTRGIDASNASNSRASGGAFRNFVVEENFIHNLQEGVFWYTADTITIRNNAFQGMAEECIRVSDTLAAYAAYGNVAYIGAGDGRYLRHLASPNTTAWMVRGELVHTESANAQVVAFDFAEATTRSAAFDEVTLYAPNQASPYRNLDDTSDNTLAQLQAAGFNASGSAADPGFADPSAANPDFTVGAGNQAPVVDVPIPDQSLTEAVTPADIDLDTHFSDPDSDPLTYTLEGSPPPWASIVTGTMLRFEPGYDDAGSGSITVRATDTSGAWVEDTFDYTVANANRAPTVLAPIPDQNLDEGTTPPDIDLNVHFGDADGDLLTYTLEGGPPPFASIIWGTALRLAPGYDDAGSGTITVRATDPGGAWVEDTFAYTVAEVNQAPVVQDPIPDQVLTEGVTPPDRDLNVHFVDGDGDLLTFTLTDSPPAWATIEGGNLLRLAPPADSAPLGGTITVRATDLSGAWVEDTFAYTVGAASGAYRVRPVEIWPVAIWPPSRFKPGLWRN